MKCAKEWPSEDFVLFVYYVGNNSHLLCLAFAFLAAINSSNLSSFTDQMMVPVNKPNNGYAREKKLESGKPLHTQLARFIVTKKKIPVRRAVLAT